MNKEICTPDEPCKECVANYLDSFETHPATESMKQAEAKRLLKMLVDRRNRSHRTRKS